MNNMKKLFISTVLLTSVLFSKAQQNDTLYAYGPGGPQAVMADCAAVFSKKMSIPVKVIAGPEAKWIEQAKQNARTATYVLTLLTLGVVAAMEASYALGGDTFYGFSNMARTKKTPIV